MIECGADEILSTWVGWVWTYVLRQTGVYDPRLTTRNDAFGPMTPVADRLKASIA
jgi:hypothetical protein